LSDGPVALAGPAAAPVALRVGRARGGTALVVFAAVTLSALCVLRFGASGEALVGAFFCAVLVVVAAIDLERRVIPNRIVLPATALMLAAQLALAPEHAFESTLAAVGAGLFFFLPLLASPAGIGMGDVKLALFLGVTLGTRVLVALAVGLGLVFVAAVVVLAQRGLAGRKQALPLGPFLALGGVVALLFGDLLLAAYFG
jgi:leader peptidase (prepilin peptidase) / N-methyltransferase